MGIQVAQDSLLKWYDTNRRPLPWRANRDPYRIWISETMLQQTTTTAVIPFFERFTQRFPNLKSLATAKVEHVIEAWAGLGYYSRARNLHKAAQRIYALPEFPRSHLQLAELPGFGPYTSRSVSSLAFNESVGVVDGNVIRVLSRFYAADWDWWQGKTRTEIQRLADLWVHGVSSYEMNQALMELGRTICMPKQPACLLCPIRQSCKSIGTDKVQTLPKPKPKRAREFWVWEPWLKIVKGRVLLEKNSTVPFLRDQWLLPGRARQVKARPKTFDYKHTITHHDIFVTVKEPVPRIIPSNQIQWVKLKEIRQYVPASLVQKAFAHLAAAEPRHVQASSKKRRARSAARPR